MKRSQNKLLKSLLLILSFALICTALAVVVSADDEVTSGVAKIGDVYYSTLDEALTAAIAAGNNQTVTLIADAEINEAHSVTQSVTLDLAGYTLNSNVASAAVTATTEVGTGAFVLDTGSVSLSIIGGGTINVVDRLITGNPDSAATPITITVDGGINGMTINHSTSAYEDETNKAALKEYENPLITTPFGSKSYFKNITVKSSATDSNIFYVGKNNGIAYFNGVKIYADQGMSTDNNSRSNKAAVALHQWDSRMDISNCSIVTKGLAAISRGSNQKVSISVKNTNIDVSTYTYPDGVTRTVSSVKTASNPALIFGGYGNIQNEVLFENCNISYCEMIDVKTDPSNNKIIFRNSSIKTTTYNVLFHSCQTVLEAGTSISSTATGGKFYTVGDLIPLMTIHEGVRFDAKIYNRITQPGSYYTQSQLVYADGSYPAASGDSLASTTYKIVYDPVGNYEAPYVVVKVDGDKNTDEDGIDIAKYTSGESIYYNTTTKQLGYYDPHSSATYGPLTVGSNNIWKYTAGNALVDGTKTPAFFFGNSEGTSKDAYNVFAFDFDIATDSANGFTEMNIGIQTRSTASTWGNSNVASGEILRVKSDGKLAASQNGASISNASLSLGEWNHITIIIDTASNMAYCYVNGTYVVSRDAFKTGTEDGVYFFGPKFSITANGAVNEGATLLVDNVSVMGYTDASASETFASEYFASFVRGIGASRDNGAVSGSLTVAEDLILKNADEAVKLNESGVYASLTADLNTPQMVTEEGIIKANGYNIASLAYGSVPCELIDGNYDFSKTRITGLKANISVYSDFGVNIYIPEKFIVIAAKAEDTVLDVSTLYTEEIGGQNYKKVSVTKDSYKSADDATVTLNLTYNGFNYGDREVKINVLSYANAVVKAYPSDSEDVKLIYFMLKYAEASSTYYEDTGNTDVTPASDIKAIVDTLTQFTGSDYTSNIIAETGFAQYGIEGAIDLASGNLAYVFTIPDSFDGSVSVALDGGNTFTEKTVEGVEGIKSTITIDGLKVYDFAKTFTITLNTIAENGEAVEKSYKYNLAGLVDGYSNAADNGDAACAKALPLVKAFYQYAMQASAYKNK